MVKSFLANNQSIFDHIFKTAESEHVVPVPSCSTFNWVIFPSSTIMEKRLIRMLPRIATWHVNSRSHALARTAHGSANILTFPSAFCSFPQASITKGSLTATQMISFTPFLLSFLHLSHNLVNVFWSMEW